MIKQRTDCVINLTTGGAPYMTIEERVRPAATFRPEVASLNMGSMNFGLFPMLNRFKEFKHEWERAAPREQPRPGLQEHLPGHRVHPDAPAPRTAPGSSSSATPEEAREILALKGGDRVGF